MQDLITPPENMETKSFDFEFKATGDDDSRTMRAVASVFNIPDQGGDIVDEKAFDETLKDFEERKRRIPMVWWHQFANPNAYVGVVTAARPLLPGDEILPENLKEAGGLLVDVDFDNDDDIPGSYTAKTWRLVKSRRVNELSFGYIPTEVEFREVDGERYRIIKSLDLLEVTLTLRGLHPNTEILGVKASQSANADLRGNPHGLQLAKARLDLLTLSS